MSRRSDFAVRVRFVVTDGTRAAHRAVDQQTRSTHFGMLIAGMKFGTSMWVAYQVTDEVAAQQAWADFEVGFLCSGHPGHVVEIMVREIGAVPEDPDCLGCPDSGICDGCWQEHLDNEFEELVAGEGHQLYVTADDDLRHRCWVEDPGPPRV